MARGVGHADCLRKVIEETVKEIAEEGGKLDGSDEETDIGMTLEGEMQNVRGHQDTARLWNQDLQRQAELMQARRLDAAYHMLFGWATYAKTHTLLRETAIVNVLAMSTPVPHPPESGTSLPIPAAESVVASPKSTSSVHSLEKPSTPPLSMITSQKSSTLSPPQRSHKRKLHESLPVPPTMTAGVDSSCRNTELLDADAEDDMDLF